MATTDARPGFKLPWSADRTESDSTDAAPVTPSQADDRPAVTDEVAPDVSEVPEDTVSDATTPIEQPTPQSQPVAAFDPWRLSSAAPTPLEPPKRKPNKLMADLTKAMQSAAEGARDETLTRLQTDAKAFIETIHARSATEAEALRQAADADVAGIREWSKAEIARIREETDRRVAERKSGLEHEIEEHAARIEQRIERVQAHVSWFETEMAGFFERLLAEEDPTRLAAMAENLPEPPSFEDDMDDLPEPTPAAAWAAPVAVADVEIVEAEAETEPETDTVEAVVEAPAAPAPDVADDDPDAAFAAIQAAAEAGEATALAEDDADTDPRLGILGLDADAPSSTEHDAAFGADEDIPTFSDDTLAARLDGLIPDETAAPADVRTTRVVVMGLVSVASIASFKRHLGRLDGVASVGVTSGPDGEFVFAVSHGPAVDLAQVVRTLPGFAAQITESTEDTISVAARDPETES